MKMFRLRRRQKAPQRSPAREALVAAATALAESRARAEAAQAAVEQLRAVIDAEKSAQAALQSAVAQDGGAALARYGGGETTLPIGSLVARADIAARAAVIAKDALPEAEEKQRPAAQEVVQLIGEHRLAVAAVLIDQVDRVGKRYLETFNRLCDLHDQLAGAARGIAAFGCDIALLSEPLEVPRFNLPAMPSGPVYGVCLHHMPRPPAIGVAAAAWSHAGRRLAEDPHADIDQALVEPIAETLPELRMGRLKEATAQAVPADYREIRIGQGVTGFIPASAEGPRERRHRVIGPSEAA